MKTFEATPFDWFNYIAQDSNSNALIQFVLKMNRPLDYNVLMRAIQYCVCNDPILGCRFHVEDDFPQWIPTEINYSKICQYFEGASPESNVDSFLAQRLDATKEPPIKISWISGFGKYYLVVKMHHAVCDAGGALTFIRLLSSMYCEILRNPGFTPQRVEPRRGTKAFFEYFGVQNKAERFNPSRLECIRPSWGTPFGNNSVAQSFAYRLLRFDSTFIERIKTFAKENGSSLNAVITMIYHRALAELLQPEEYSKEIQFTANLHSYTKEVPNTICNLSNIFTIKLPTSGDLASSSREAKERIDTILDPENIIQTVLGCEMMSTNYKTLSNFYLSDWENIKVSGTCTPMISNVGRLDSESFHFGESAVEDMYIISPAFVGPSFMLGVSTFHNVMTCCISYQKPSTSDEFVEELLSKINELISYICSPIGPHEAHA